MSQWLDVAAENSIGSKTLIDTSGVSLDSITFAGTSKATPTATTNLVKTDSTMLYLTAAGVVLAAYAILRGR